MDRKPGVLFPHGREKARLFIPKDCRTRVLHGNGGLSDPVKALAAEQFAFDVIRFRSTGQVVEKPQRLICREKFLSPCGQPISPKFIPVVGVQQALLLERLHDVCFVRLSTRQTGKLI